MHAHQDEAPTERWTGRTTTHRYLTRSGGSTLDACLFMEETARGLAPVGGYATTLIVAGATSRFGSEDQKKEILGGVSAGSVEAIAMTEPESGSDVGSLTIKAERVNGGFVINGQKVFISNAHIADHVLVVCRTTKGESKHEGLTMTWVPREVEGMESSRSRRWAGVRPTRSTSATSRPRPRRCAARSTRAGPS